MAVSIGGVVASGWALRRAAGLSVAERGSAGVHSELRASGLVLAWTEGSQRGFIIDLVAHNSCCFLASCSSLVTTVCHSTGKRLCCLLHSLAGAGAASEPASGWIGRVLKDRRAMERLHWKGP